MLPPWILGHFLGKIKKISKNQNTNVSKFIFKARSQTLEIKTHKKWKYDDTLCTGCKSNEESGDEILSCASLGKYEKNVTKPLYEWFFSNLVSDMVYCAKVMMERLKFRQKIIENG